jgi:cytochrome P450
MQKQLPAGPSGSLILGSADEFKGDPLNFLTRCKREFGGYVPFRAGPFPFVLISEPDLIHEVLVSKSQNFIKDLAIRNNHDFFGNGLLSSEGDYWRRQRKLASPSFSPSRLEQYTTSMLDIVRERLSKWTDGQTVEIQSEMMYWTFAIAVRTLFDADLSAEGELGEALTEAQHYLSERLDNLVLLMLPEWVPFPANVRLHEAIKKIDGFIYRMIEERRGFTTGRKDLLSTLLDVRDDDGTGMTDQQIRDEVFTLFFAGHETTAVTMSWVLHLLSEHPRVEQRLLDELTTVLGDREPTPADAMKLEYTYQVIREAMRIRPPVWMIGREPAADCEIGGYPVEKGTAILMSQWVNHHDEKYFENPEQFSPERWTNEFTSRLPKFAYYPFGGGPRICIGNNFALLETILLLASILRSFHLESVPGQQIEMVPAVTLRPRNGIKMTLKKRS